MRIAPLRERLLFQVKTIEQDELGNESAVWEDQFSRWCSCRPMTQTEFNGQTITYAVNKVQFTLRYDKEVLALNSLTTRIIFRGATYAIESIDGDTVPRQIIYILAKKEELGEYET